MCVCVGGCTQASIPLKYLLLLFPIVSLLC
uniref:Uncharacterized protein n=1 Tax=Anguilla anguilla TaxID=7936 RepID=A0A0E9XTC7_ANGAN